MRHPMVLAAATAESFEQFARKTAEIFPESIRENVNVALAGVVLAVLLVLQLGRAVGLLRRLALRPGWRRVVVLTHFVLGALLASFTVLVWSLPSDDIVIQAVRILVPYESLAVTAVGIIGVFWMMRDHLRRRAAERSLERAP